MNEDKLNLIDKEDDIGDSAIREKCESRKPSVLPTIHSMPNFTVPCLESQAECSNIRRTIHPSQSFYSNNCDTVREEMPKRTRRPYEHSMASNERESQLYMRFKYYSRLRPPVESDNDAFVIPDHVVPSELFTFYIPGKFFSTSEGKQASIITILSVWNTMMGTSILAMPWAFGQAGFAWGIFLMVLQALISGYTASKLLQLQNVMGLEGEMHEFGFLFRSLWSNGIGKMVEGTAVTFSLVNLLGVMIVYWVLMTFCLILDFFNHTGEAIYHAIYPLYSPHTNSSTDVLCPLNASLHSYNLIYKNESFTSLNKDTDLWFEEDNFHKIWTKQLSVPLFLTIPFIFLLSVRNTNVFRYFNSLGAISVLAIYSFVIFKAAQWGFHFSFTDQFDLFYIPNYKGTFMALSGTLSLAYFIHNCIISIMKANRHPENNVRDLSIAYCLVAATYIPIAILFYLSFPMPKYCIMANFLDNFPSNDKILAVVRVFLLFQMVTVYPLLTYFFRSQFLSYVIGNEAANDVSYRYMMPINLFLVAASVAVAIFYPNIGVLIRWIGALSGLAFIFILPAITDMRARYNKGVLKCSKIFLMAFIITYGVANFVSQFFS